MFHCFSIFCIQQNVKKILKKYSLEYEAHQEVEEFTFAPHLQQIEKAFSADTVEEILRRLENDGSDWAKKTAETIKKMSPTSLKVTLKQMRKGKGLSLKEGLELEYIMGQHFCADHDFYEGAII